MPKTVTASRHLKASPERVFRAWTDPEEVKRWFKPARLIMNVKVDGLWHSDTEFEGKHWPHYSRFLKVEPPRLLEETWSRNPRMAWSRCFASSSSHAMAAPSSG